VRDEEALDGTIEYDDIDPIVGLDRRDDLIQLWDALRAKDVERRVVEGDAPVTLRALFETDAFLVFSAAHCCLVSMNGKPSRSVRTAGGYCIDVRDSHDDGFEPHLQRGPAHGRDREIGVYFGVVDARLPGGGDYPFPATASRAL
jgi:hypothetical protein